MVVEYKDWVNVLLQCATIGIVLSGVIGYLTIRNKAKKQATKIATKVSKEVAEKIAEEAVNKYIQQELPAILESYKSFIYSQDNNSFDVTQLNEGENDGIK